MAYIKNLIVRVGADLSGLVSGFAKGGGSVESFASRTKKATKESAAALGQLKNAMAQGGKNAGIVSLTDQIHELEDGLRAAGAAGFGWGYETFENDVRTLQGLKAQLNEYVDREFNTEPTDHLVSRLKDSVSAAESLGSKLTAAKAALKEMEQAGLGAGDAAWDDMYKTVARLTQEVNAYKRSLTESEETTHSFGAVVKSVFSTGARAAKGLVSGGISFVGNGLRGVASVVSNIGHRAKSSSGNVGSLSSALKKVGATAVGIKLVGAVLGRLRSLVSTYIAENTALQAQVNSLKSGFGQALAPAINLVTNALSALMPYIVGVSNAIGSLITNLFGSGWTTVAEGASAAAAATGSAASAQKEYNRTLAGFDEITKLSRSQTGGGGGSSSSTTTTVQGKLPAWLTDLSTQIKDAIGNADYTSVGTILAAKLGDAVDSARAALNGSSFRGKLSNLVDGVTSGINGFFARMTFRPAASQSIAEKVGALVGDGVSLALSSIDKFLSGTSFGSIGTALAQGINGAVSSLNASDTSLGKIIADLINSGVHFAAGLVQNLDWSAIGTNIQNNLRDVLAGIDISAVFSAFGAALAGIGTMVWTTISESVQGAWSSFQRTLEDCGGNIWSAIWTGIKNGFFSAAGWFLDDVLIPFVDGISSQINNTWVHENILDPVSNALNDASVSVRAQITGVEDARDEKTLDFEARVSTYKSTLADPAISATAKLTAYQDLMKEKTLESKAKLTTYQDSTGGISVSAKAALTTYQDKVKNATVSAKANLTTYKDSTGGATVSTRAKLTTYKDNLSGTTVTAKASLTSYKDSLGNKALNFKANVTKGWSGDLAQKLGVSWISSKLSLKLPKISIEWGSVTALGKSFQYPKGFSVKWNAQGAILNGAQIFGSAGNTWLGGGENGREAVLPLDRNTWWMDKIADRVALKVVGSQGGEQNIVVQLVLDGKVITQTVIRNVNGQARATGRNPLAACL